MPMPRQARTASFSSSSLRLCAFALICCSLLASSASAGYPPETETLSPGVMPQLPAAEGGTAECAEHAERHTYRRRPVPPRVTRGISRVSLALDGLGLYPSRQKRGVPHVARASRPWGSWARCPCHGRRRRSPSPSPLCDSTPLRYPSLPFLSPPPRRGIRPRLRRYKCPPIFLDKDAVCA